MEWKNDVKRFRGSQWRLLLCTYYGWEGTQRLYSFDKVNKIFNHF